MEEQDEKLVIDASRLDSGGEELSGEVVCVDLDEPFVKAFGGVRYTLFAQVFGNELLVRGTLEQDFDLVCSRCGKDFDDTVKVEDFTQSYEISDEKPEVDLTEDVRESVILALPSYPVCAAACPGVSCAEERPADDRWSALDSMQVGDAVHVDPATGRLKDPSDPAAKRRMPKCEPGRELKA